MNPENQFIPRFPPEFVPGNGDAFDVSDNCVVACASGAVVHLAYLSSEKLNRGYSVQIGDDTITALKFDGGKRQLAVGNDKGSVFLLDIDTRSVIASCIVSKDSDRVCAMVWRNSILIVLKENGNLMALSYSAASVRDRTSSYQHHHFSTIWEVELPANHCKMELNPHTMDTLLLWLDGPQFSMYKFCSAAEAPVPVMNLVTLNGGGTINHATFSLHMPDNVFLVLDSEILMFNTSSQGVSSVVEHQRVSSPFSKMMQFPTNDSQIYVMHKSGTISVLNSTVPNSLVLEKELVHKHKYQKLANWCKVPLDDKTTLLWYVPTGIALYDVENHRIKSFMTLFTNRITGFGSDGVSLAMCTNDGSVICTDIFDSERTQLYRVAEEPVLFAAFCPGRNRVHWHTKSQIGAIDLSSRSVRVYCGKSLPVTKAVGSFEGGLLVQRTPLVLGVFVDDKEMPILLDKDAIDFCFDEGNASIEEGRFAVLLDSHEITLYSYSSKGVKVVKRLLGYHGASTPTCIGWCNNYMLFGGSDGTINRVDLENTQVDTLVKHQNWKPKSVSISDGEIFGMSNDNTIFHEKQQTCIEALNYFPISKELILVLRVTGDLEMFIMPNFIPLSHTSTLFSVPSSKALLKEHLLSGDRTFFSREARDVWLCLEENPPLRMMAICGVGSAQKYANFEIDLVKESTLTGDKLKSELFSALLFADRFTEASDLMLTVDVHQRDYQHSVLLSCITLGFVKSITPKQQVRLKSSALMLFQAGRGREAAMLLRLAKLDTIAIDYLLEHNDIDSAVKFLRTQSDKSDAMFRCGAHLLRKGKLKRCVPFFAACNEFHPLLHAMYTLGEIADCHFIKRYAEERGLFKPLSEFAAKMCGPIIGFEELGHMIDAEFQSLLCDLNIEVSRFFKTP